MITAITCDSVGIVGTTKIFIRQNSGSVTNKFEARVGISIFGRTNMDLHVLENLSPFDKIRFQDNYAKGFGKTQEEAIEDLKRDIREIQKGLFA